MMIQLKENQDIGLAQNKLNWMPLINLGWIIKNNKIFNKINEIN